MSCTDGPAGPSQGGKGQVAGPLQREAACVRPAGKFKGLTTRTVAAFDDRAPPETDAPVSVKGERRCPLRCPRIILPISAGPTLPLPRSWFSGW